MIYIVVRKGIYDQGVFFASMDKMSALKRSGELRISESVTLDGYHHYEVREIELDTQLTLSADRIFNSHNNFIEPAKTIIQNGGYVDESI